MHRRLIRRAVILCIATSVAFTAAYAEADRELLRDPGFEKGVSILNSTPGRREVIDTFSTDPKMPPAWEIAQWASRFPKLDRTTTSGTLTVGNAAKTISLRTLGEDRADLQLAVKGSVEYGDRARGASDPWLHLLAEQTIADAPPVGQLKQLQFRMSFRLDHCELNAASAYNPEIHAAQFVLFLHVSNTDRESKEYGKYLHFGVPIFDNRYPSPPAHIAPDTGDTGMHIYMPAARDFVAASAHDKTWVTIDRDLLPMIQAGLRDAWNKGLFGQSRDLSSYRVTFITLGWELPGNFDASLSIRDLSLRAIARE